TLQSGLNGFMPTDFYRQARPHIKPTSSRRQPVTTVSCDRLLPKRHEKPTQFSRRYMPRTAARPWEHVCLPGQKRCSDPLLCTKATPAFVASHKRTSIYD